MPISGLSALSVSFVFDDLSIVYALSVSSASSVFCDLSAICALSVLSTSILCNLSAICTSSAHLHLLFSMAHLLFVHRPLCSRLPSSMACLLFVSHLLFLHLS